MIVASLLLILVAVTLLVMGLVGGSSTLLISSIAASLLAAIALVVGARQAAAARRAAAQPAPADYAEMPAMAGASAGGPSTASRRRGRRAPSDPGAFLNDPPPSDPGAFLNDPPPSDEGLDSLGAMQARAANRDDAEAALEADAAYREEEASGSAEGFYPRTHSSDAPEFAESVTEDESGYSEGRSAYADAEPAESGPEFDDLSTHDHSPHDHSHGDIGHGSADREMADSDISDSADSSARLSDADRFSDARHDAGPAFSGRGFVADPDDDPADIYDYDGDLSHGSDDALLGETRVDNAAGWAAAGGGEPYPDYDRASSFIGGARSENPAGDAWRTGHADDTPADLGERPASQGPASQGSASQGSASQGRGSSDEFDVPDEDDPADEPLPQAVSPADAVRVARMNTEVMVVDGRPRYHVADCPHLDGRRTEGLPAAEAVELGFSPCGLCRPVDRLVAQSARR
jgi:clumping factor A